MQSVTGVITLVQETRFRLVTDQGQGKLFLLSHDAPLEPQDLPDLQRDETRVTVHFTDADDLIAGIAHDFTRPNHPPRPAGATASGGRR
jgi:hypothetical protein